MQQHIRLQVDLAADTLQFGPPTKIYRRVLSPSQKRSAYGSILMYVCLIMFFPSYLLVDAIITHMQPIGFIMCVIFFASFSFFTLILTSILFFRIAVPWYVLFYSEGLISAQGRKITAVLWDQVLSIQQKFLPKQVFLSTSYLLQYTLHMVDNTQFTLANTFLNLETADLLNPRERDWPWFKWIGHKETESVSLYALHVAAWKQETELIHGMEREVVTRLFPEVIATYQAGRTVTFGQLQISIKGISDGEIVLSWRDLDRITLYNELDDGAEDDSRSDTVPYADSRTLIERLEWWQNNIVPQHTMLIIEKEKDAAYWSLKVSEIPNAFLFMSLADYALHLSARHE